MKLPNGDDVAEPEWLEDAHAFTADELLRVAVMLQSMDAPRGTSPRLIAVGAMGPDGRQCVVGALQWDARALGWRFLPVPEVRTPQELLDATVAPGDLAAALGGDA